MCFIQSPAPGSLQISKNRLSTSVHFGDDLPQHRLLVLEHIAATERVDDSPWVKVPTPLMLLLNGAAAKDATARRRTNCRRA